MTLISRAVRISWHCTDLSQRAVGNRVRRVFPMYTRQHRLLPAEPQRCYALTEGSESAAVVKLG